MDLISRLQARPRRSDFIGKNIPEFLSGAGAHKVPAEAAEREAEAGAQGEPRGAATQGAGAVAALQEPARPASEELTAEVPQKDAEVTTVRGMKRRSVVVFLQLVVNTVRQPPRPVGTTPPLPSGTTSTMLQPRLPAGSAVLRAPLLAGTAALSVGTTVLQTGLSAETTVLQPLLSAETAVLQPLLLAETIVLQPLLLAETAVLQPLLLAETTVL